MHASDPILLTPGPLTTSHATREAMLRDWDAWGVDFTQMTRSVCADLVRIAQGQDEFVCVPLQGSGTFAVEATLGTLVPRDGRVLVPNNGAYCARIARILTRLGIAHVELAFAEHEPVCAQALDEALARDPSITHVALVHLETSAGIVNPLDEIAAVCGRHRKHLIVDAMSSFGALPIALADSPIDAVISASGKCVEGVPGIGFAIVRRTLLRSCEGRSPSLALDLHDQYTYMRVTSQWRFTPPTHVLAALRAALDQLFAEGGQPARGARYAQNCHVLIDGMRGLGFEPFLDARAQGPVIATFHAPRDHAYSFHELYKAVREAGYLLYPGRLTTADTFRVACIGAIGVQEVRDAVAAIGRALDTLGIRLR
ncbi:2-aminoethylphosphonate--pyruvate aminotransferase [Burkholderia singularis]|uniref:2-aminoethylphosphonate--pyruvate transaminase n=1 Tax=Burkholderia singularis TaxID=1503053 RepID=A0A103DV49_9BURK|nr:2-aminoethylphosphonate--pyruvate transaminase [Burkholderia singularis]KVE23298.1 2-aminoethylphosphonate--pyruvate aminotransferase [Burkholderia singularis]